MKDLIIDVIKIIAPISVALIVFCQGLLIAPGQVGAYFRERPWLMMRSLAAVLILVPAAALGLILALKPPLPIAIGLAILVACPPAPLMISAAPKMGKGSVAFMASLHLALAMLAFVTVPVLLYLLSVPLGFSASVDLRSMAWILARTIVIPISLGLAVRAFFPAFAERAGPVLAKVGTVGLAIVVVVALGAFFPALVKMEPRSYLVIAAVGVAALAIGHLFGPADPQEKTTLAVECGVRHPALALTIAASNFTPEKALPVLVPAVLAFILVATIYMIVRARMTPVVEPASAT